MESLNLILSCLLLTVMLGGLTSAGSDLFDQRCTEASNVTKEISPNQTTTIITYDSCDALKNYVCRGQRCGCSDPANQIYSSREFKAKHLTKRSPFPGKGKGKISTGKAVAGGAIAGVAGAAVGYQLGKAANGGSGGGGSSGGGNGGGSGSGQSKKITVFGCYSRVQGDCVIDRNKQTFVENSTTTVNANGNSTSTTTIVQKQAINYSSYPLCIDHGECKPKRTYAFGQDSNIGECVCKDGYKKTSRDICISGVDHLTPGISMILSVFLAHFLIRK